MDSKQRLDVRVAAEQQVSRTKAAAMIMAGEVRLTGGRLGTPGQSVSADEELVYTEKSDAVSRAAGKLTPALDQWKIEVTDKVALDVGSSTGGFTQVLLARNACKVYAVDVGRGQLDWQLRNDPRVVSLEQTDIRALELPERPTVVTIDVSFISLRKVLPAVARLVDDRAPVIALFKPQFEVGKPVADRFKGVISDETVVEQALEEFLVWATEKGWLVEHTMASAVVGTKGNRERLVLLRQGEAGRSPKMG